MAGLLRYFRGGADSRGYLALSPTGASASGKLPTHTPTSSNGGPYRTADAASPPSLFRSKALTLLLVGGVAILAVWADRTVTRRREAYSFDRWLHRTVDPSLGSQKSQAASLKEVCNARPGPTIGTGVEVGTMDVGMDRMLSEDRCNIVFPALYKELDRSVAHYETKGHIKTADLGTHATYAAASSQA